MFCRPGTTNLPSEPMIKPMTMPLMMPVISMCRPSGELITESTKRTTVAFPIGWVRRSASGHTVVEQGGSLFEHGARRA